jgi:integrase
MANGVMNKKELKKAYQAGLIDENRFKEELFKLETINAVSRRKKKLPVSITEEEFVLLLQNTDKERFRVAFLFGYGSGMRLSEIVGGDREDGVSIQPITKEKIDLKGKFIRLEDAKGGKDRIVPLPKGFKEQFLKYLPFTQGYSNIESCRRSMEKAFKRAAEKAGLLKTKPSMHFHSLRHGFGTRMANQGVPIHQIRTLMGHSNISTTNIYLEANPQEALKNYEKLF